jgi:CRISPR-associated protein Cas5 subtype I-B
MEGLTFDITSDFAHFKNPFTLSFFETLLAPSRPTILGLIGACLGLNERETIEIGEKTTVGCKINKIGGFSKEITTAYNFKEKPPQKTPIMREIIINPEYRIHVASEDRGLIKKIHKYLHTPRYPLYLGISEFLAYIKKVSEVQKYKKVQSRKFDCIVPKDGAYNIKVNLETEKKYFPPKEFKTIHSYAFTRKGRVPVKFINLLMFFGYEIEFQKEKTAYENENNEIIYLL